MKAHDIRRLATLMGLIILLSACDTSTPPVPEPPPPPPKNVGDPLVIKGHDLFFKETFNGNGRTCGTCHREEHNLTIDAAFIATLPKDDPLFVAEFTPALAKNFEVPKLMREFGLILETRTVRIPSTCAAYRMSSRNGCPSPAIPTTASIASAPPSAREPAGRVTERQEPKISERLPPVRSSSISPNP